MPNINIYIKGKIMEQNRKHLRISSFLVLFMAALTLLRLLAELAWGEINYAIIPDGAPENVISIAKTFLLVTSLLFLLPEVYVGIKGLRIAKKPNLSKGHIVWAIIIFALTVINIVSPLIGVVSGDNQKENLSTVLSLVVSASIYFDYIKYARLIAKEN